MAGAAAATTRPADSLWSPSASASTAAPPLHTGFQLCSAVNQKGGFSRPVASRYGLSARRSAPSRNRARSAGVIAPSSQSHARPQVIDISPVIRSNGGACAVSTQLGQFAMASSSSAMARSR